MTEGDVKESKRINYGKVIAEVRSENLFRGGVGGWVVGVERGVWSEMVSLRYKSP